MDVKVIAKRNGEITLAARRGRKEARSASLYCFEGPHFSRKERARNGAPANFILVGGAILTGRILGSGAGLGLL